MFDDCHFVGMWDGMAEDDEIESAAARLAGFVCRSEALGGNHFMAHLHEEQFSRREQNCVVRNG